MKLLATIAVAVLALTAATGPLVLDDSNFAST